MPTLTPPPAPRLPPASRLAWPAFLFAFGVLLASYPARNPDIWGHLAAGREAWSALRLADTATPLFDLLAYAGDAVGGGVLLVSVKAAALGLLGVALFEATRGPSARLLPAAVVGLALLAVSQWANLRPQAATYLLLGLAAWWLTRHPGPPTLRQWWPLVVLFAVWTNLDRGVGYGLAAVALTLLGRCLDGPKAWGRVGLLLGALAVASLLNPTLRLGSNPLPAELQWLASGQSAEFARSPLSVAYLRAVGDSPAALAYYPLLALSLFGFLANRGGFRWGRFLPSAAFALLSGLTDRAVPLFAVVAAPAAALNLGEALAARRGRPPFGRWVRVAPALVAGLFLAAAWPGWLQRSPYEPRRWAYDLPTAPAAAAEYLNSTRGAGRTLHLTAESRAAFRWHCPTDDGFHDPQLVADLVAGRPVEAALREARVARLVLDPPDADQARPALNVLLRDRHRWPLQYLGGGVAVFGWRDPARDGEPATGREIDLTRLWQAGLEGGRTPVPLGRLAPAGAGRWREVRAAWATPRRAYSPDRDEAALLMTMAEVSKRWVPQVNGLSWYFEQSAGLAGGAAGWASPAAAAADAALRLNSIRPPPPAEGGTRGAPPPPFVRTLDGLFNASLAAKDDYLSGALAAAVRAGRRAVAADPDDPRAYLTLGEAYLTLWVASGERVWGGEFKQPRELRQAQAVAALRRAVELSATPPPKAHRLLALAYRRVGYLDLALDHLTEARKAERSAVPGAKPDPESEADFGRLRDRVGLARARLDKESAGLRVGDQAALAAELGLNGRALELLLKSDVSAFGAAGLRQQLEHMVRTGQARLVTEWTSPEQLAALGPRSYHWLRAQAFAGLGDYDAADSELVEIGGGPADLVPDPALLASSAAAVAAKNALGEASLGTAFPDAIRRTLARAEAEADWRSVESRLLNLAEVSLLRGVLALEVGDRGAVRRHANAVLFFAPPGAGGTAPLLRAAAQSLLDRARDPDAPRPEGPVAPGVPR